jgi:hypothetical protein
MIYIFCDNFGCITTILYNMQYFPAFRQDIQNIRPVHDFLYCITPKTFLNVYIYKIK